MSKAVIHQVRLNRPADQEQALRDFSYSNETAWFAKFSDGWVKCSTSFAAYAADNGWDVRLAQRSEMTDLASIGC